MPESYDNEVSSPPQSPVLAKSNLHEDLVGAEKDIVDRYGGWSAFCWSFGRNANEPDENAEMELTLRKMAATEHRGA